MSVREVICACQHYVDDEKETAQRNLILNGTRYAHIVGFQLVHAPPV